MGRSRGTCLAGLRTEAPCAVGGVTSVTPSAGGLSLCSFPHGAPLFPTLSPKPPVCFPSQWSPDSGSGAARSCPACPGSSAVTGPSGTRPYPPGGARGYWTREMAVGQQDMQKTRLAGESAHAGREQDGGTRGDWGWAGQGCLPAGRPHTSPVVRRMWSRQTVCPSK